VVVVPVDSLVDVVVEVVVADFVVESSVVVDVAFSGTAAAPKVELDEELVAE
jgi:hypothetical protein